MPDQPTASQPEPTPASSNHLPLVTLLAVIVLWYLWGLGLIFVEVF